MRGPILLLLLLLLVLVLGLFRISSTSTSRSRSRSRTARATRLSSLEGIRPRPFGEQKFASACPLSLDEAGRFKARAGFCSRVAETQDLRLSLGNLFLIA